MKNLSNEDYKRLMLENELLFDEYEKVKFSVKINGVLKVITNGVRVIDNNDIEYFIANTSNQGYVYFGTDEVGSFEKIGTGIFTPAQANEYNPATKIQETLAQKIKQDQAKSSEESRNMAFTLSNELGYFPLVSVANVKELIIDFYDSEQKLLDSIIFPFVKGENYEVYSHEDERDIEFNSLIVDTSLAMDSEGNDVSPSLFAKYYETYNVIQDLEFIPDNQYTKEIFTLYKLDEKFAKVVGDFNKHELLDLVTEYSKDPIVKQAAFELRVKPPKITKPKL
jgi:hypothetical protein